MLIAIDYDDTYTADPLLWEVFASSARSRGHRVILCTGRAFPPAVTNTHISLQVHCTGGEAKAEYLAGLGIVPDIWIDDDPMSINISFNP